MHCVCRFYLEKNTTEVQEHPEGVPLLAAYSHSFRLWLDRWLRAMIRCVGVHAHNSAIWGGTWDRMCTPAVMHAGALHASMLKSVVQDTIFCLSHGDLVHTGCEFLLVIVSHELATVVLNSISMYSMYSRVFTCAYMVLAYIHACCPPLVGVLAGRAVVPVLIPLQRSLQCCAMTSHSCPSYYLR